MTLSSTLAVCGMIAAGLFAAKPAFAAPGWVWVAGMLFLVLAVTAALAQSSAGGRGILSGTLRTSHYTQFYRYVARGLNDWVWRRVGQMQVLPDGAEAPPSEKTPLPALLRAALTWRLLDRALLFAVVYPVLALLLPWLLGGDAVLGAGIKILESSNHWLERFYAFFFFSFLAISFLVRRLLEKLPHQIHWRAKLSIPLIPAAIAFVAVSTFNLPISLYFVCVSIIVIGASTIGSAAGSLALVIGYSFFFSSTPELTVTFYLFVSGTALALDLDKINNSYSEFLPFFLVTVFWVFSLSIFSISEGVQSLDEDRNALIVFLAVLPLINGLFDALSYAITLALSRKGLATRWAPLWGLLDLAMGAVLFLFLGATMVGVIGALNGLGTAPIYDLAALFDGLRASPGDYWWLYLILFSTLAPTALHILVAALAVQGWFFFQRPRRAVARWIEVAHLSHPVAVGGCLAQALIWWLPLVALAGLGWVLWQVIGTGAAAAGLFYLDRLEGLALWIGAI